MKRTGIIISDPHCGHRVGLTHPVYQQKPLEKDNSTKKDKWYRTRVELWDKFDWILNDLPERPQIVLSLGDNIDGNGKRSGGVELLTTDREEQSDMAVKVYQKIRTKAARGVKIWGVYGTAYHTGEQEDWENIVAERAGFDKMGSHEWVDVNGCIIDMKHHSGSSAIPHGRATPINRERLWNAMWSERKLAPKADVILRGHAHFYMGIDGPNYTCIACPALQGMGSKYGSRRCSGIVDWGLIYFEVDDKGNFEYKKYIMQISSQVAKATKI